MEFFNKQAVRLKSHLDKYLVADDDQQTVRQSRNGSSRKIRWLVESVDTNSHVIRLKSCHGRYLTASNSPFLLTGNKVLQTIPENMKDLSIEWQPIRDGFQVKLRGFGGTYLRGNGGTPPWRDSVTHDKRPHTGSAQNWVLWGVEGVDIPEDEQLNDYFSLVSSFSSLSDELSSLDGLGSPVSIVSAGNSPRFFSNKSRSFQIHQQTTAMDLFQNAKAVRLRSHHDKYLTAEEDEESVSQDRNGSSKNARWTVEFLPDDNNINHNIIRLKSCYNKYLTASNQPFLLGMTGRKVLQTLPRRLDSSVEWEPIRDGHGQLKLRTRYGQFLRANGGLPPWRNSVTHDIPHRTATQEWIFWHVDVVEIVVQSPAGKPPPKLIPHADFSASDSSSPSTGSSASFSRQESANSLVNSPPKREEGRTIYYHVANEYGDVDEDGEEFVITFKGNGVDELTHRLEEETGLTDITICSRSPLDGKLYPLRLQLPPNNVTMNVVVVQSSPKGVSVVETGIPL